MTGAPALSRAARARRLRTDLTGWAFVAPALLLFLLFVIWPMGHAVWISLHRWDGLGQMAWLGLDNYRFVFGDKVFWKAMHNTFIYAFGVTVAKNLLALGLALLLNRPLRGRGFFRTASFTPVVLSFVVVGVLWSWIFDPTFGLLNAVLWALGLQGLIQGWLSDPDIALYSIMFVDVWKWTGYHTVLFLAGLQTIPSELIEAGRLEGKPRQVFRHVTLPLLMPVVAFSVLLSIVGAFVSNYDLVRVMTQGGPFHSTEVALTWITTTAFRFNNFGKADAMSVILFLIVAVLGAVQFLLMRQRGRG
ncbi:carbohydrate ABC transporter permease [Chachezhania sediminis]|uniref:carbohydrate ABC transporter permease n=1 Tax=Chachezhania sediminis TaxID=2599291 RepID=UPI00131D6E5D|nr:sugar ABC transporter permease [Chachezhania sediminis]